MVSDSAAGGRAPGMRAAEQGFYWEASSPSPAAVERLESLFPEVVAIPAEALEAEVAGWQSKAIIARSFHRWVPAEAFIREFRRAGVPGDIKPISLAFRCHIFCFDSPEAWSMVLQRPWVVNGQAIGTEAWRPDFSPAVDSVSSALIWVRLPNLPLEYWKEDFLKTILASAGEFMLADAATVEKNRGAFARVCLRVDLRRPLRPGARVQGLQQIFWQSFVYENLQGICYSCASLHLAGSCPLQARRDEEGSASEPAFGPWLAAVRQRKVVSGHPSASKELLSGSVSATRKSPTGMRVVAEVQPEGWLSPAKLARRRPSSSSLKVTGPEVVTECPGQSKLTDSDATQPVPFQEPRAGSKLKVQKGLAGVKIGPSEPCLNISVITPNPFASLDGPLGSDGQMESRSIFSGPLKRARPEVSLAPRTFPNSDKRKGKGKVSSQKRVGGVSNLSSVQIETSPSCQKDGQEVDFSFSSRGAGVVCETAVMDSFGQGPGPLPLVSSSKLLTAGVDTEGTKDCSMELSVDGSVEKGDVIDCIMVEDQGGVPNPPSL